MIFNSQVGNIEVLMMKGEKADPPVITETPIDNGYRITIDDVSFDLHNATSGDYSGLTNKPSINGTVLNGDLTSRDINLNVFNATYVLSSNLQLSAGEISTVPLTPTADSERIRNKFRSIIAIRGSVLETGDIQILGFSAISSLIGAYLLVKNTSNSPVMIGTSGSELRMEVLVTQIDIAS